MKKFLVSILFVVISLALFSQERTTYTQTLGTLTVNGLAAGDTIVLPLIVDQWDVSIMLAGAIQGVGDSAVANVDIDQSNVLTGDAWAEIVTDSSTAKDGGLVWETSDFNGLRLRIRILGNCLDSAIFTPYIVYKRKPNELPL